MKLFLSFFVVLMLCGLAIAQPEVLEGEILENTTLTTGTDYLLRGGVFVGNDEDETILTIEPGVTIYGENNSMLVIRRGSKIMADGTRENPIVFTSAQEEGNQNRADWGGLIINGRAPLNAPGGEQEGEGDTGWYGGGDNPDPHDNSGILRYVRVEFAGYEISADNELNGIAFQAVGDGTVVEYIQVHMNKDDGIEFFGGTVNAKYLYVTGAADDSFDWTDGWTGKGQFWVCHQYWDDCDQGFECDNSEESMDAEPRSHPHIYNVTLIGAKNLRNGESDQGMLLRHGTGATIKNAIVMNFGDVGLDIDNESTLNNAYDNGELTGGLIVDNSILFDNHKQFKLDEEGEDAFPDVDEFFLELNMFNRIVDPQLMNPYDTHMPDYRPRGGSPAMMHVAEVPEDDFFDQVDFIGGVGPDDNWLEGWTIAAPAHEFGEPIVLEGQIEGDTTLTADNMYILRGGVFIGNDEDESILHIEQGTTIYGENNSMLVIRRGSKIMADGSPYAPIVMTSAQEEGNQNRADWGGLIINGRAPLNAPGGEQEGEGDTGWYGGGENPDPHDNSGILNYVRVEYAGYEISADNELNGIAFQAVGDATVVDYIQVHMNKDDGVEFFGGTVNAKHVYVTGAADDSFDWTDGWTGMGQFWVCQQYADDCDQGIEADNSEEQHDAVPFSNPTIYNLTLIGAMNDDNGESDIGILLRHGTNATIKNAIVHNFGDAAIDIDNPVTFAHANDGLTVDNSIFYGNHVTFKEDSIDLADEDFTVEQFITEMMMHNRMVNPMLEDPTNMMHPSYWLAGNSPARHGYAMVPENDFFDDVDFIGGVDPDHSWLVGWTTPGTAPLSVDDNNNAPAPREFAISNVYPNPFNPSANLTFNIPWNTNVVLNVFDVNGRMVDTMDMGSLATGQHTVSWNGANASTGMYVFVLNANGQQIATKGMLVK